MGAPRLYTLNENYFENIDTEDRAYWLGFIYADGYIHKRKKGMGQNVLGMTLHEREPLESFMRSIESNKPVKSYITKGKYNTGSVEYKSIIISDKIVSDIEKWGVVERKTFELSNIPDIQKELIPHFVRGYFDGDGSVFLFKSFKTLKNQRKILYKMLGVHICGTFNLLNSIRKEFTFLDINSKTLYKEMRSTKDIWGLKMTSNRRCIDFYKYLYPSSTVNFLKRKRDIFENYFDMYSKGEHKILQESL